MTEKRGLPDWDVLINFGLPVNSRRTSKRLPDYNAVEKHLIIASEYLKDKKNDKDDGRYYDSFRSLLIALKIHYPSEFKRLEQAAGSDFNEAFELNRISGRDIKLRNISLNIVSSYYNSSGISFRNKK